jgi:hypothetical protein
MLRLLCVRENSPIHIQHRRLSRPHTSFEAVVKTDIPKHGGIPEPFSLQKARMVKLMVKTQKETD